MNPDGYWRINELKNFLYCPRISYYSLCLGIDRETGLSQLGIQAEQENKQRMKRRKHALHTIHQGQRWFDVQVFNHDLRLVGRLDEVIQTDSGLYLVDYKDTNQDYGYWQVQMAAYRSCLASEQAILGCYIYIIPSQQYHEITPSAKDTQKLGAILQQLEQMVQHEICPSPIGQLGKCRVCQYARFCNDIF